MCVTAPRAQVVDIVERLGQLVANPQQPQESRDIYSIGLKTIIGSVREADGAAISDKLARSLLKGLRSAGRDDKMAMMVLDVLKDLLQRFGADMGASCEELGAVLLPMLEHEKESVRKRASVTLGTLVRHVSDAQFHAMMDSIIASIERKDSAQSPVLYTFIQTVGVIRRVLRAARATRRWTHTRARRCAQSKCRRPRGQVLGQDRAKACHVLPGQRGNSKRSRHGHADRPTPSRTVRERALNTQVSNDDEADKDERKIELWENCLQAFERYACGVVWWCTRLISAGRLQRHPAVPERGLPVPALAGGSVPGFHAIRPQLLVRRGGAHICVSVSVSVYLCLC